MRSIDIQEWENRVDGFCLAWSSETGRPNYEALSKLYAPDADVQIYDTLPPIEGFQNFSRMRSTIYPELAAINVCRTGPINFKILCNGNVVVTNYPFHLSYGFADGTGHEIDARISEVWEKRGDTYVIVHEHPSTIYSSPPIRRT
ncbi:nuclear transport factor 2 family protein [Pseudomonas cavernae]|uniref:Nuclear transport factor 2 family protein n=1 Tax=Pseudomonas cavernae TaxID=2320867 RepID=A0A385Z1V1_9PSED|nr:nuclear transport factor 2 family protein [Pseudomonas cavernae]